MNLAIEDILKPLKNINKEVFTKNDIEQFLVYLYKSKCVEEIEINGVFLNPELYSIKINDKEKILPKKQFLVLHYLLRNPSRVVSRSEFIKNCWDKNVVVGERTVDVHICKIKKIIKDKIIISTHKSYGYKWKIC